MNMILLGAKFSNQHELADLQKYVFLHIVSIKETDCLE